MKKRVQEILKDPQKTKEALKMALDSGLIRKEQLENPDINIRKSLMVKAAAAMAASL